MLKRWVLLVGFLLCALVPTVEASVVVPTPNLPTGCANNEIPKYNSASGIWQCATDASSGEGGTPGGADTQVQINDGGVFGGDGGLTYNTTTNVLTVSGGVSANASTASSLAANGSNCGAGEFAAGVDAGGASEGCTDLATQTELDAAASEAANVTSAKIANGTIVNEDINAGAAIDESKLNLNFPTHTNEVVGQEALQTLAASDDIEVTATLGKRLTVPIAGADGAVTLTSDPQITAGSDTQVIVLVGTDEVNSVTIGNGMGVLLCGSSTSEYIISTSQSGEFQYDAANTLWRQINCRETVSGEQLTPTPIEQSFTQSSTGTITGATPDKSLLLADPLNGDNQYGWRWNPSSGLENVRPVGPQKVVLDDNSPVEVYSSTGTVLAKIANDGTLTGSAFPVLACTVLTNVDGSDNLLFGVAWPYAVTVTGVYAVYQGSAPATPANFTLADGDGNAFTIAGSSPTPVARTAIPTIAAVTDNSASQLSVLESILISVSNTPSPTTDTYQMCLTGLRR